MPVSVAPAFTLNDPLSITGMPPVSSATVPLEVTAFFNGR